MRTRTLVALLTLATGLAMDTDAAPTSLESFSAALDEQWNYGKPAESEQRFRAELANWPADDPRSLVVLTQIARTQGLRRQFAEAHATLDGVQKVLDGLPSHVRVRYLLERGRTLNSSGARAKAVPLFAEALALAQCNGDAFYAVDAAHMLGIAAPQAERLDWDLRALAMAEQASDPRARRWIASLLNNIGYAYQERGDFATAIVYYRKALVAFEARGDPGRVRVAHWMVARAQRSLGQLDEAERTQRMLLADLDKLGETDGYVYEELAEIALARGDAKGAQPWATKAHAALKDDPSLAANEPARLARLAAIGAGQPVGSAKP
jgi:tetratricopeptide (TPR) repeat protein